MIDDFIIRKKRRAVQEEEAGGGWKIALADFMCALMITFFSLWAIGQQDEQDMQILADYFKGKTVTHEQKMALLDTTFEQINEIMDREGLLVSLEKNSKGIVIKFDSESLFESGSPTLKPNAHHALVTLARETKDTGLFFHLYGYTDNIPVRKGSAITNNLFLSAMRATSAASAVIEGGMSSNRVTIHGEGLLNPASGEDTPDARKQNRRVELYMSYSSAPHKVYKDNVTFTKLDDIDPEQLRAESKQKIEDMKKEA